MASRSPRHGDPVEVDDDDGDKTPEAQSINDIDTDDGSSNSLSQRSPTSADAAAGGSSGTASWWSYDNRRISSGGTTSSRGSSVMTHQSARHSLTGDRMIRARSTSSTSAAGSTVSGGVDRGGSATDGGEPVWDLSDSLAELYENEQLRQVAKLHGTVSSSTSAGSTLPELFPDGNTKIDVESWLAASPDNGFIRVYSALQPGPGGVRGRSGGPSRLVQCDMSTTALTVNVPKFCVLRNTVQNVAWHH